MNEWIAEVEKLRKQNKILELKNSSSLANNLCPDHRDKQAGKSCLACEIERLLAALKTAVDRPLEVREIMKNNDLKIDNLEDPYQKLALTLYTMIVEAATEAEDLITRAGG